MKKVLRSRRGVSMVEYALLAALIALVAVAAVRTLGTNVNTAFTDVGNAF